ncbi:MAG: iron-sulfur cluster assembly protein [Alphaproteobacteria bacterium]
MALITITDQAAEKMLGMLTKRGTPEAYIRMGIKTAGCSGLGYRLEYADVPEMGDELVEEGGARVLIDAKALIYIIGTEVGFESTDLKEGFVFTNPNQKGECGCGESFTV